MKKRVLAALLWFYTGWYGGAIVAHFLGISELLGPVLGAAIAAFVAGDPRGIIWGRRDAATPAEVPVETLAPGPVPAPQRG